MEWVEVSGKTVDIATSFALKELGLASIDEAVIEIMSEGERGFLGIGGKDAVVRVKPKSAGKKRRRRKRGRGPNEGDSSDGQSGQSRNRGAGGGRSNQNRNQRSERQQSDRPQTRAENRPQKQERRDSRPTRDRRPKEQTVPTQEQADVVRDFLEGLVKAFGLEGTVEVAIDDEIIVANILGDQTEAMVGPRGSVIEAIHEVTKTVLMRKTDVGARVRLDIAGHADRRRQALSIYAGQLIEQLLNEGGEIVLEPMSAADRKVIHDAAADRDGVQSYSEGEAPRRYVVLSVTSDAASNNDDEDSSSKDDNSSSEEE